jgi:hypothetical protein
VFSLVVYLLFKSVNCDPMYHDLFNLLGALKYVYSMGSMICVTYRFSQCGGAAGLCVAARVLCTVCVYTLSAQHKRLTGHTMQP